MKKVSVIIATLVILASVSCKEQKDEPVVVEKTETIVIEKEAQPVENDGTSISVDKNGVEFSNKNGDNKTEINLKDENNN